MKHVLSLLLLLASTCFVNAQNNNVGIGTTNPTTKLTVNGALSLLPSFHVADASILIPDDVSEFKITFLAGFQQNALTVGQAYEGQLLVILNGDDNPAFFSSYPILANGGVGAFVHIAGSWHPVVTNLNNQWLVTGNAGTNPGVNFIGTTDNKPLIFRTDDILSGILDPIYRNVALGQSSTHAGAIGFDNVFIGDSAGTTAYNAAYNTFLGSKAGAHASAAGNNNILIGFESGKYSTANQTIAIGYSSGLHASSGQNVFMGAETGMNSQNGNNTFIG